MKKPEIQKFFRQLNYSVIAEIEEYLRLESEIIEYTINCSDEEWKEFDTEEIRPYPIDLFMLNSEWALLRNLREKTTNKRNLENFRLNELTALETEALCRETNSLPSQIKHIKKSLRASIGADLKDIFKRVLLKVEDNNPFWRIR